MKQKAIWKFITILIWQPINQSKSKYKYYTLNLNREIFKTIYLKQNKI